MTRPFAIVALSLAVLAAGGCSMFGHKHAPESSERVTQIGVEDAPKELRHGVERDYPGSRITRIERVRDDEHQQYIVYLTTNAGELRELRYDMNGNKLGNR